MFSGCLSILCPSVRSSVCPSVYTYVYMYIHPSIRRTVLPSECSSIHLSVRQNVRPVRTSIRTSVHPSVSPSEWRSICPPVHPSVCPSIHWSIGPSICPSISLFVCMKYILYTIGFIIGLEACLIYSLWFMWNDKSMVECKTVISSGNKPQSDIFHINNSMSLKYMTYQWSIAGLQHFQQSITVIMR